MSIAVMTKVWASYPGAGSELLAMLALADWADDNGRCWPSMAAIAGKTRLSRSQAQRIVHGLIDAGYVSVTGNETGGKPGSTRQYQINLKALTGSADATPTGRTNARIKGWMGRADQTTKVRGMFVHPGQVAAITKRFPQVQRARLVVTGAMANDQMVLQVETTETAEGLALQLQDAVREVTKLRGEVQMVAPGSLPNDGKVIEDARSYE